MKNLTIIKENIIHNKWMDIKEKFKSKEPPIEELDKLTQDLLAQLGALTSKGYTHVNEIDLDVYKNRVWNVVENIGLLPEVKEEEYEDSDFVDEYELEDEDY